MVDLKEGVHVRPERRSGPKWENLEKEEKEGREDKSIEKIPNELPIEPFDERPARRNHPKVPPTEI